MLGFLPAVVLALLVPLSFSADNSKETRDLFLFRRIRDGRSCSSCGRRFVFFKKRNFRKVTNGYCEQDCKVRRPDGFDECGSCLCTANNSFDCSLQGNPAPCGFMGTTRGSTVCKCHFDFNMDPVCVAPPVFVNDCPTFCNVTSDCAESEICLDVIEETCFDQSAGCDSGEFPSNRQCAPNCALVDLDII